MIAGMKARNVPHFQLNESPEKFEVRLLLFVANTPVSSLRPAQTASESEFRFTPCKRKGVSLGSVDRTTERLDPTMKVKQPQAPAMVEAEDDPMADAAQPGEQEDSDVPNGDFEFDEDEDEQEDEGEDEDEELGDDESGEDSFDDFSEPADDGGVSLAKQGRAISPSSIPMLNQKAEDASTILSNSAMDTTQDTLNPQKPSPYIHDPGHLLISDPNPLPQTTPTNLESTLAAVSRDAAQSMLNHMLTTCPIHRAPAASASSSGITMTLPQPSFQLPRSRRIPQPKAPTKWEQFAAKKGIGKHNKRGGVGRDGELQSTEGKTVYDEATGEWVPKWGYKGRNKKGENEWLVEVDEKKEQKEGQAGNARTENRATRVEKMRRNERAQRANEKRARRGGKAGG